MRFKVLSKLKVQALAAHALLSRTVRVLQILSAFYIWSFCSASSLLCCFVYLVARFIFAFACCSCDYCSFFFFSFSPSPPLSLLSKISYICCRNNAWKLVHSWPTFLVVQWETERQRGRKREEAARERERQKNESVARLAAAGLKQLPKKRVDIYTDTQYISDWYQKLQQNVEQRIKVGGDIACDCCAV